MRRTIILCGCLVLVCLLCPGDREAQAQRAGGERNPSTPPVKTSGCVKPGVEAGCLVLKGFKDKKLYNLIFVAGKKPEVGIAISFEGHRHEGPTVCMQGTPVDVSSWTRLKTRCQREAGAQKP